MKKLLLILLPLLLMGCRTPDKKKDNYWFISSDGFVDAPDDPVTEPITVSNPSGFAEGGPFQGYSKVTMWPLNATMKQIGDPVIGDTRADDSGFFIVYADLGGSYIKTLVEGQDYNEVFDAFDDDVKMESTIPTAAGSFNANYWSSIVSIVGNYLYHEDVDGPYYHLPTAFDFSEIAVHDYFNYSGLWEAPAKKSYESTITGDATDDAKLELINSTIAFYGDGPAQGAKARQIAEDIYKGIFAIKSEINLVTSKLNLSNIKNNLDTYYASRSLAYDCAPIFNLPGVPSYYADLTSRTPTVLESFNASAVTTGIFDTTGYKVFAFPLRTINAETAQYLVSNLDGDAYVYEVTTHLADGYFMPDTAGTIISIETLREQLIDSNYIWAGKLSSGLSDGDYFLVVKRDSSWQPTKVIEGDAVPFGKNMACNDAITDCIGFNNTTSWFTRQFNGKFTD